MSIILVAVNKVSNPDPDKPCPWRIDPIELRNDNDQVIWNLDELLAEYETATKFALEFISGPSPLSPGGGPFKAPSIEIEVPVPSPPKPFELIATNRGSIWGLYTYNILVYYKSPEGTPLWTPIDPQIDNIMPPPPPQPLQSPDKRRRMAVGV
jgi:hypothetical protein